MTTLSDPLSLHFSQHSNTTHTSIILTFLWPSEHTKTQCSKGGTWKAHTQTSARRVGCVRASTTLKKSSSILVMQETNKRLGSDGGYPLLLDDFLMANPSGGAIIHSFSTWGIACAPFIILIVVVFFILLLFPLNNNSISDNSNSGDNSMRCDDAGNCLSPSSQVAALAMGARIHSASSAQSMWCHQGLE